MTKPIGIALPWNLHEGEGREFVYITDADGEQIARMAYAKRETARHIVNCVNAFDGYAPELLDGMVENGFTVDKLSKVAGRLECELEEKTHAHDCLLSGICAPLGGTSTALVADSEGGTCD